MPDRYDPKPSARSFGDRRPADPHGDAPSNDDPLAELARIVSGAGRGQHQAPAQRPRTSQPSTPDPAAPASPDPIRDLEAELLSDLQASFGAARSTPSQAPSHPESPPEDHQPPQEEPQQPEESQYQSPPHEEHDRQEPIATEPHEPDEPDWGPPEMAYPEPEPPVTEPEPAAQARPEKRPADFGLDELLRELQSPSFGEPDPEPEPPQPMPTPPARPEPRAMAPEPPQPAPQPPSAPPEPPEGAFEAYETDDEPASPPRANEVTQQPPPPAPPSAGQPAPPAIPPVMPPSPRAASTPPRAPAVPPSADVARPGIRRAARAPIQPPPPSPGAAGTTAPRAPTPDRLSAAHAAARPAQSAASTAETPTMAPVRGQSSRWDKPSSRATEGNEPSRFAPPGAAAAQTRPGPADEDLVDEEDLIVEDAPFLGSESGADDVPIEDARDRGLGAVPGYGDDDDRMLPFPEEELDNLVKRRSHRGLALVAVLLAVILAGSVALLMFRSGGDGAAAPPIITADGSPTKVTPEASDNGSDPQSKLIYDRVDSGESETDTTLLTFDDDPIDLSAQSSEDSDNAITRVIIPGEAGVESPSGEGEGTSVTTAAVNPDNVSQPIGPRRVRTVVVKPDGTIVSSEASAVDGSGSTSMAETGSADEAPAVEPLAIQSTPDDDTAAIAAASGFSEGDELEITELPDVDALTGSAPAVETQPAAEAPAQAEAPALAETSTPPQQTAAVAPAQPAAPAPSQAQTESSVAIPPGGVLVQVSSQRSEESALATYRDLQARYPAILGSYQPIIQRADLGDRGIYYRVRVGPFSNNDADLLCSDLKSAGGDCILARN